MRPGFFPVTTAMTGRVSRPAHRDARPPRAASRREDHSPMPRPLRFAKAGGAIGGRVCDAGLPGQTARTRRQQAHGGPWRPNNAMSPVAHSGPAGRCLGPCAAVSGLIPAGPTWPSCAAPPVRFAGAQRGVSPVAAPQGAIPATGSVRA